MTTEQRAPERDGVIGTRKGEQQDAIIKDIK